MVPSSVAAITSLVPEIQIEIESTQPLSGIARSMSFTIHREQPGTTRRGASDCFRWMRLGISVSRRSRGQMPTLRNCWAAAPRA